MTSNPVKVTSLKDKPCSFCIQRITYLDYKNLPLLRPYINYFAKIKSRYYSGVCLKHQKKLALAIKKARYMALFPFYR